MSSGEAEEVEKSTDNPQHNPSQTGYHNASLFGSILNLIKNLIGASMLAMPYGASLSGIVPSFVICMIIGTLSAFTFSLLGLLCAESRTDTYRQVCERYLGPRWGVAVDVILSMYALPTCIGYCVFTCDCMQVMLVEIFPDAHSSFLTSRAFIAIIITIFILIPLCSFSKIQSLTFTSILGLGAILYCYIFVATDLAEHSDVIATNVKSHLWLPPSGSPLGLFPIANIYAACFLVQYNSPKFYFELRKPSAKRFVLLSFVASAVVVLMCGSFAIMGVARFGFETPSNLLKKYKSAYAVWTATTLALITTYPFDFDAGRRSLVSMISGRTAWLTERRVFWLATLILIPLFSLISVFVDSLSTVVGMNGSLLGITVGFTLPGLLLYKRSAEKKSRVKYAGVAISCFGVIMSILGFVSIFIKFH